MVSVTQIDLAIISMLSGELISIITIRMLLNEKKFIRDTEEFIQDTDSQVIIEINPLL